MNLTTFVALASACAPAVHPATALALVGVESSYNPHAIGVVGGALLRQPRQKAEALATARALQAGGWDFSLGLAQINVRNLERLGLTLETALEPCANLGAMQVVLADCHDRATTSDPQRALRQALSCYYSGDLATGFRHGYVQRVARAVPARGLSGVPP
jgi:type IV secretion system protein VirB1